LPCLQTGLTPDTVWVADFETPACKSFLFISADTANQKEKEKKCCCLMLFQSLQPIQYVTVYKAKPAIPKLQNHGKYNAILTYF
jgi:hypothetical protein